jgi:hypothetical protein
MTDTFHFLPLSSPVAEYLDGSTIHKGTLMCIMALMAWYCTIAKEVNKTFESYFVARSIPVERETRMEETRKDR